MMNLPPVVNTAYVCPSPVPAHVNMALSPGHPIVTTYTGNPGESKDVGVNPKGEIYLWKKDHCYRVYFTIVSDTTGLSLQFDPRNVLGGDAEFQSTQFNPSNAMSFSGLYKNTTCSYSNRHCSHPYSVTVFDGTKFYPLDPHVHNSPPLLVIPIVVVALLLAAVLFLGLIPWWRNRGATQSLPPPASPSDDGPILG